MFTANQMTGFYIKCNTGLKWARWELSDTSALLKCKSLFLSSIFSRLYSEYVDILFIGWRVDSSHVEVLGKKGALKNFSKFTGKNLWWTFFFDKVAGMGPANLLKKRLQHRCSPVNLAKFFDNTFSIEHFWWLFLKSASRGVFKTPSNV